MLGNEADSATRAAAEDVGLEYIPIQLSDLKTIFTTAIQNVDDESGKG